MKPTKKGPWLSLLSLMLCGVLLFGLLASCNTQKPPQNETDTGTEADTETHTIPQETESTETETESAETEPESTEAETESTEAETDPKDPSQEDKPKEFASDFYVGYAIADITPKDRVPLSGYGNELNTRISYATPGHRIYATCVAVKSGNDVALLYNLDLIGIDDSVLVPVQQELKSQFGIPPEYVLINCSHTHSAPSYGLKDYPAIAKWLPLLHTHIIELARDAIADFDRCEAYTGSTHVENMNFVRRYLLKDGSYDTVSSVSDNLVSHETEADDELQIIHFRRQNKQPVVMVNWRAHPCMMGSTPIVSGDYISEFRMQMEAKGYLFAFHQGAAGNVTTFSAIRDEYTHNHKTQTHWYGEVLTNAVIETLPKLKLTNTDVLQASSQIIYMQVDHSTDNLASVAKEIYRLWCDTTNPDSQKRFQELCKQYDIPSAYAANAIVARYEMPETQKVTVYALSFGDIAFATAPFEIFQETGVSIKEKSPYQMTFASGYTNGSYGYLPASHAFPHHGYEVDTCKFVRGSAETIARVLGYLLEQQRTNQSAK